MRLAEAGAGAGAASMRAAVPLCVYTRGPLAVLISTRFFFLNCLSPPRRCAARSISFSAHLPAADHLILELRVPGLNARIVYDRGGGWCATVQARVQQRRARAVSIYAAVSRRARHRLTQRRWEAAWFYSWETAAGL